MTRALRKIEIDEATANLLETRAAERGISVSELVSELVVEVEPVALSADELAELDRRWAAVKEGEATVSHDRVVRWLETWGTPAFGSWRDQ